MSVTAQQILDACNQAILDIVTGAAQEKVIDLGGGRQQRFTALNISDLRRLRDSLKAEIAADSVGSTFVAAQFLPRGRFSVDE